MKKLIMMALLATSVSTYAAKPVDKYAEETYAASRVAYQMTLNALVVIDQGPGRYIIYTNQEPAICWPFPTKFEYWYRAVQNNVNAQVEALPKRDQGKVAGSVGWYVWNALQNEFGC